MILEFCLFDLFIVLITEVFKALSINSNFDDSQRRSRRRSLRFIFRRFSLYHGAFGLHLIVRVISGACLSFTEVLTCSYSATSESKSQKEDVYRIEFKMSFRKASMSITRNLHIDISILLGSGRGMLSEHKTAALY